MSNSHTNAKLNWAHISWFPEIFVELCRDICRWIAQKYSRWVNFSNSNYETVRVDYIKMSTVQCASNMLFLTLEQVIGRIKCWQESFCTIILNPLKCCYFITARKNTSTPWSQLYWCSYSFHKSYFRVTPFTELPHVTLVEIKVAELLCQFST